PAVPGEDGAGDLGEGDAAALMDGQLALGARQFLSPFVLHAPLDDGDDAFGLVVTAVDQQPARALRDVPADQEDHQGEDGAQPEGEPPAEVGREDRRVERDDRQQGPADRAQPVAAVDEQAHAPPVVGGDQLVDGGVDGRVLAPDAEAGQEAEEEEPPGVEGERGQGGGAQVDREGDHEEFLAAPQVGEAAPEQGAGTGSGDVQGGGDAGDLAGGDGQAAAGLGQAGGDVADDGDLEAVEDPHRAEADDDRPVPAGPGQAVQAGGNARGDGASGPGPRGGHGPPPRLLDDSSTRPHPAGSSVRGEPSWGPRGANLRRVPWSRPFYAHHGTLGAPAAPPPP